MKLDKKQIYEEIAADDVNRLLKFVKNKWFDISDFNWAVDRARQALEVLYNIYTTVLTDTIDCNCYDGDDAKYAISRNK